MVTEQAGHKNRNTVAVPGPTERLGAWSLVWEGLKQHVIQNNNKTKIKINNNNIKNKTKKGALGGTDSSSSDLFQLRSWCQGPEIKPLIRPLAQQGACFPRCRLLPLLVLSCSDK